MSEIPHPQERPRARRRRKPGHAARTPRAGHPASAANPLQGQYEEYPQQPPTISSEHRFTVLPSRRGRLPVARVWLGRLVRSRVAATLTAGLLVLCAMGALAIVIHGIPHPRRHPHAPPARRVTVTPDTSTLHGRRRVMLRRRRRPPSSHERAADTRARERPAGRVVSPAPALPRTPAPAVNAAPSESAGSPAGGDSGEGQTQGGLFSP
jgi:hypothetical protein